MVIGRASRASLINSTPRLATRCSFRCAAVLPGFQRRTIRVPDSGTFPMNVAQIYDGEAMEPVELEIELEQTAK